MSEDKFVSSTTKILNRVEDGVLAMVAVVLAIFGVAVLINMLTTLIEAMLTNTVRDRAVDIMDGVLLVVIVMEIFYTVTLSLKSHTLVAEPFLIVGAITAVRRILVITASTVKAEVNVEKLEWTLVELGLLAIVIIAIAFAVFLLRKGQQYPPEIEGRTVPAQTEN